jgi:hypothetical protein
MCDGTLEKETFSHGFASFKPTNQSSSLQQTEMVTPGTKRVAFEGELLYIQQITGLTPFVSCTIRRFSGLLLSHLLHIFH